MERSGATRSPAIPGRPERSSPSCVPARSGPGTTDTPSARPCLGHCRRRELRFRSPAPSARDEPETPPRDRPALPLDPPEQRGAAPVEHLVDRRLGALGQPGDAERSTAPEADPEPTAEVPTAPRTVDVLDPQLHAADVVVEASERVEEMPVAELPEA